LIYLDWLLDHQAEFCWLVLEKLGKEIADSVEWRGTRLLCIAADFTRYDQHAVQQIQRNIELLRYKLFDEDLLLLELANTQTEFESTPQSALRSQRSIRHPSNRKGLSNSLKARRRRFRRSIPICVRLCWH